MNTLIPLNYHDLRKICNILKCSDDNGVLNNSRSQFLSSVKVQVPCSEKQEKSDMVDNTTSNNRSFLSWLSANQIFASVVVLSIGAIITMLIYAFATRYYVVPRQRLNIDRWTGEVQEWDR